ncbi:ABC transporter ATP-binding protein [Allonocardiopsis opalescens]|uniref:NitT/TauT family transport system ATP-binding protein/sulfonate transport system ATP-binding protein n=1 Tax=Allonocardiopsis opalescens TaxID=1144618 RepID=A0A2T0QEC1_9ACTN|nr:ABC transporter ATP-binding protein [Allonocardiopsis opalescens]PRY02269.1 NitT/TauT family transport system ATP-binding protein/sulfonate transport system ATP-binding protein [Allonocardiopsis opalescens]
MRDPEPAAPKIRVDGVAKFFEKGGGGDAGQVRALDGVDLDIAPGEFLTVIGPSGCGKTTLLRIIASLTDPDAGRVLVDGKAVDSPSPERAMVFQSFGLFPWKTVLDNVRFPLRVRKAPLSEATETAMEFLGKVGLADFAHSHPHQLSGGMQQRVGLARALATDPDILLMDEPFGAIDAQTRELMQEELMRLWQGSGKTVVFVTHDLDEAVLLADRVLLLSRSPGTVRALIPVDLPRPRWDYDVRALPGFTDIRARLWSMLRDDLVFAESHGPGPATAGAR